MTAAEEAALEKELNEALVKAATGVLTKSNVAAPVNAPERDQRPPPTKADPSRWMPETPKAETPAVRPTNDDDPDVPDDPRVVESDEDREVAAASRRRYRPAAVERAEKQRLMRRWKAEGEAEFVEAVKMVGGHVEDVARLIAKVARLVGLTDVEREVQKRFDAVADDRVVDDEDNEIVRRLRRQGFVSDTPAVWKRTRPVDPWPYGPSRYQRRVR
jgi:hypothetical protein